ncbi:hypothetical protein C440_15344 [Haloferax mucosum ATCC BAA-1512]|uniref:DUF7322 domain-containing protein n=1 Tax=Haloferax mucosum ATCC BAA-1512 TaxID=662479 RepID=M0I4L9_9EURY|nr:hypothetical protein [Haloferax mucosum]ELZ91701.1 hypothetical protein C440_15344 [Haloferax mucosum ATCC BAA-1512]
MTDDERREDGRKTTEPSSPSHQDPARSGDDIASRIDPKKRWGDPEARWGDPETELPNIPRVRIPGEDDPATEPDEDDEDQSFSADIDPEAARLFWASVVLANIGVGGVAVGAMLLYFRDDLLVGGGLVLLGIGSLVRVYFTYREFERGEWSDDEVADADDDTTTIDDTANAGDPDRIESGEPGGSDGSDGSSDPSESGDPDDSDKPNERNR